MQQVTKALVAAPPTSINDTERTVRFIASTEAVDCYGEIVEQSWDFTRFDANPVFLNMHCQWDKPLGQVIERAVKKGPDGPQLEIVVRFLKAESDDEKELEAFEAADEAWALVKRGMLRAVSVGFIPGEVVEETVDGVRIRRLRNNELTEVSLVTLPANPEAVAKSAASQAAVPREKQMDDKQAEELRQKVAALDVEAKGLREKCADFEKVIDADKAAVKTLTDELDRERAAHAEAKKKLGEHAARERALRVEGLVSKGKLLPSEKEAALELLEQSEALFVKVFESRAEHGLTEQRVKSAPPSPTDYDFDPAALAKEIAQ